MNRITQSNLEAVVLRINRAAHMPTQPYANGKPQAGCYHLSYAYGGAALHRMSLNEGSTAISDVLYCGHVPKRELFNRMLSFCYGIEETKEAVK